MATSKTLNPTNVTISIPAMSDVPDAAVFSNCVDKEADAINTLNTKASTYDLGSKTIATMQSTFVTYWGTMSDGDVKNIRVTLSDSNDYLKQTNYVGSISRISSTRFVVDMRQAMTANNAVMADYNNGTWNWTRVATASDISGITSGSFTAGAKFSIENPICYKMGSLVLIAFNATASSSYSMSDTIVTLPATHRPVKNCAPFFVILTRSGTTYQYVSMGSIKTTGEVTQTFSSSGSSGDNIKMMALFNTI